MPLVSTLQTQHMEKPLFWVFVLQDWKWFSESIRILHKIMRVAQSIVLLYNKTFSSSNYGAPSQDVIEM